MGVDTGKRYETRIKWQKTEDRSTQARLNYSAVERLDLQHAVRVCSKSAASPRKQNWMRLKASDGEWSTLCRMHPAPSTSLPRKRSQLTPGKEHPRSVTPLTALDVPLCSPHAHRLGPDCTQSTVDSKLAHHGPHVAALRSRNTDHTSIVWSAYGKPHPNTLSLRISWRKPGHGSGRPPASPRRNHH